MTSNNLPAIKQTTSLQKIENKLAITNKLLAEINDEWLVDFFVRNYNYFIELICKNYSLSDRLLEKYFIDNPTRVSWSLLSINTTLNWTIELIDTVEYYLKWKNEYNESTFSNNISLPWSLELIEKYKDRWDWGFLSKDIFFSSNNSFYYSLIDKFIDNQSLWDGISKNCKLPWSLDFIEKYKEKLEWRSLSGNKSLPWSIELIEKYKNKWDWGILSGNKFLPWSIELIDKFYNEMTWQQSGCNRYGYYLQDGSVLVFSKDTRNLSSNTSLPWSIEFIERYKSKWDWDLLSGNTALPWSIELIEIFYDYWGWLNQDPQYYYDDNGGYFEIDFEYAEHKFIIFEDLVTNPSLPWSMELIDKYKHKWDWRYLCINSGITWNAELLNTFEKNINLMWFSKNKNFKWSIEQIEKYNNVEGFISNISNNTKIPWSIELIEKYINLWDWHELEVNKSLPWSKELILRFEDKWYRNLYCENKYFNDFLLSQCTDQIVEKVIKKIQNKL